MKLSELARGRNNNFNLIRILAALAVLITHGFAIAIGTADAEPFRDVLGMSIGDIAVDVFFVASGFLVTASLFKSGDLVEFFVSRACRIYPALWVMLALSVLALGAYFTTLPLSSYYRSETVWSYLAMCGSLVGGVAFNLPGVFGDNPYANAVNGSLWSMPFEVRMYIGLAAVWWVVRCTVGAHERFLRLAVLVIFASASALLAYKHFHDSTGKLAKLLFMFSCGSAYHVLREKIPMDSSIFWAALIALAASAFHTPTFFYIYCITLAYILFYLAYVPGGAIRGYNRLGDYSYGLYIYAFPVQQAVAAALPGVSVATMVVVSGSITLVLAVLSWHLLEERAIGWRHKAAATVRRVGTLGSRAA